MRIGAHVPVGAGLLASLDYAVETGCECIQVFARNPRAWEASPRDPEEAGLFSARRSDLHIGPLFTHASYLINVGSDDPLLWERSIRTLADELVRAALIGADGVVLHAGTTYAGTHATPSGRIAQGLRDAWEAANEACDPPPVLLENSSGAGRFFGGTLDALCEAASEAAALGVTTGVCFDTCHGFAAGIDVRTSEAWADLAETVAAALGPDALRVVHSNDSVNGLGSHVDRHAWIGDGEIGSAGFQAMFAEPRLAEVPVILEMSGERPQKELVNLGRLRELRAAASARLG